MRLTLRISFVLLPLFYVIVSTLAATPDPGRTLSWTFPLPRTHTGILMGNGIQGLMIWGGERQLNITIARAGFWDHRNGMSFAATTTYNEISRLLKAGDEAGLRRAFGQVEGAPERARPHQLGGGRLQVTLPAGWSLRSGKLLLEHGIVELRVAGPNGKTAVLGVHQSAFDELSWLSLPPEFIRDTQVTLLPTWDFIKTALERQGVKEPERWASPPRSAWSGGFVQTLPEDPALAVVYRRTGADLLIATALADQARAKAERVLAGAQLPEIAARSAAWWQEYWAAVPRISLPDPVLQEIVDYGLYKQACSTPEHGIACALQGPFMEEYQVPPWSNDYHFNINIQMIYWPALASNRTQHFGPLWKMVGGWLPQLRANAEHFFQAKGAMTLPHAVDDRAQIPGFFWTGMIDHGSTAWVAQMAWLHYRYSMDPIILEEWAWPLLNGAFEGYWAMFERIPDGQGNQRLSIPVSVSPEFKGARMDAWGRDASFQLAACHMLADILPQAAAALGKPVDPRWEQVRTQLPPYTTIEAFTSLEHSGRKVKRIALWEGMDLLQSHRHHSHLASIYPFCTIDPLSTEHADIVRASIDHWVYSGPGAWSGWCVPWASTLHARLGNTEAAVQWLHFWKEVFTNEGRGTLHNANFPGVSTIQSPVWSKQSPGSRMSEVMQLDAGFGALTAVFELLVQNRRNGEIVVLPALHKDWKELRFDRLGAEGGFRLGASVKNSLVDQVRVESTKGGHLRLRHGLGEKWFLNGVAKTGEILEIDCKPGEKLVLDRTS